MTWRNDGSQSDPESKFLPGVGNGNKYKPHSSVPTPISQGIQGTSWADVTWLINRHVVSCHSMSNITAIERAYAIPHKIDKEKEKKKKEMFFHTQLVHLYHRGCTCTWFKYTCARTPNLI